MEKKLTKSAKLDLILSELSKLKDEIKKLQKHKAAAANQGVKAVSRSARSRRQEARRIGAATKPAMDVEPSKPVLVEAPQAPKPVTRIASRKA